MASTPVQVKKAAPAPAASRVPATDPWYNFRNEIDRLFDRFTGSFGMPAWRRMFDWEPAARSDSTFAFAAPSVDVAEDDKAFHISAELPGLEAKDIEVSVADGTLVITGEKKEAKEHKNKSYYMSERAYGSFQRSFALPEQIDRDKIAADLSKGVLTITLPKTAVAQKPAKKVEVKAAA